MSKILLIDDDEVLLQSLGDFVEAETGACCLLYTSLAELRKNQAKVSAKDTVLAIIDINLGAGVPNGIDVYRWLQQQGFPGAIVFLTGHAKDHPLVKEASLIGGTKVFAKPMEIEKLVALVHGHTRAE